MHWGHQSAIKGYPKEALTAYRKAATVEPNDAQLRLMWENLIYHRFRTSDKDTAIASYRELLRLSPKESNCWYELGILLQQRSDHRGAVLALRQAVNIHSGAGTARDTVGPANIAIPGRITILTALGHSLRELEDLNGAEAAYQQAMKLLNDQDFRAPAGQQPIAAKVVIEYTVCLLRQNKVKEANAACEEFVRRASGYLPKPKPTDTPPAQVQAARTASEKLAQTTTKFAERFL